MCVDNVGEGGILMLMLFVGCNILVCIIFMLVIMGLIGGSFFYGEVVIMLVILVMLVIEGLEIVVL